MDKWQPRYSWGIIVFGLLLGLFLLNQWMLKGLEEVKPIVPPVPIQQQAVKNDVAKIGKVTDLIYLDANRTYSVNTISVDGQQVAQFKSTDDKIFDITGHIPEGKIKFTNQTDKTYGEERFRNDKRYGEYKEYYETGQLKLEKVYESGEAKVVKQYYIDGILRMEEDFTDTLRGVDNKEVGAGKVYYRNGTLMYEWRLTNKDKGGYNKSYNKDGGLVAVNYFDEQGNRVENKNTNQ